MPFSMPNEFIAIIAQTIYNAGSKGRQPIVGIRVGWFRRHACHDAPCQAQDEARQVMVGIPAIIVLQIAAVLFVLWRLKG